MLAHNRVKQNSGIISSIIYVVNTYSVKTLETSDGRHYRTRIGITVKRA